MKTTFFALLLATFATSAFADDTCKSMAADKKLAGAAMTSFMKKCTSDAGKTCDTKAKDQKLAGAAKNSFTKKCVTNSVGT